MEENKEEKKAEKEFEKKEKNFEVRILNWFKDSNNAILFGILVLAFIIRIYYLIITKNQALWWDALCYGSLAKNFITHTWNHVPLIVGETTIRPMILPLLWSLLLRLKLSELTSKFILEFIPSMLTIFFIYIAAKKLYNKRIALISAFVLTVSWMHIFYSMRMLTRVPGLLFSIIGIYFFFKSVEHEKIHLKYFALAVFFAFIAVLMRWTYGLTGITYILFLIFTRKLSFIKQKAFWIGGIIGSIPIISFFLINLVKYNHLFPALSVYSSSAAKKTSFAFYTINFIPHILQKVFLIFFILGLVVLITQLILGFGYISKIKKLKSHLFILILLLLNLSFLIFYIKESVDSYLFECFISIILIVAIGLNYSYLFIKKHNKLLAILFLVFFLAFGSYSSLKYGDAIIQSKKESFMQMKQAFLWAKDNTPEGSVFFGKGLSPYIIYYGERDSLEFSEGMINSSSQDTLEFDYVVIHAFNPHEDSYINYLTSIQENLTLVHQVFFPGQSQPAVAIYRYDK